MWIITELKNKRIYNKEKESAKELFEKEDKALAAIKWEKWYKVIRWYWERIKQASEDRLITASSVDELKEIQIEYRIARDFINELNAH